MIPLPNGCRCSEFNVFPDNWKSSKASLKKDWYVMYRFYDADGTVKQVKRKRMNTFADYYERRDATETVIEYELVKLRGGYNPITKKTIEPVNPDYEIDPKTPLVPALRKALKKVKAEEKTKTDIKNVLTYVDKSALAMNLAGMPVKDVKRRHIKMILEHCEKSKKRWSANLFNHYRKYLNILFNVLLDVDSIESNPIKDIKPAKTVKKIRETLSETDRKAIDQHLRKTNYTFWRYLHVFFHSGSRSSELMRLQGFNVDLSNQRFKVTVIKGAERKEVWKTIKDIALPLWEDIMKECGKDDYVFARGLKPGPEAIQPYQINKRWTRLIMQKDQFKHVKATFYQLKHLNTTEIVTLLSEKDAAAMNSHSGVGMVRAIYDTKQADRQHERLKSVNNKFA